MKLYESAGVFAHLFEEFENLCAEPEKNENGYYIDEFGSVIPDVVAYIRDRQEAWFDTLSGIEEEFEVKAENIGAYIKALTAAAEDLKAEEYALAKRRKAKEKQAEWLKKYLLESMQAIGRKKIDRPMAVLSVRSCPESVRFEDENAFITLCQKNGSDDYLRYKKPEINRSAVKEALQAGKKVEGAYLARDQRIDIK